jgi:hypothetical protein
VSDRDKVKMAAVRAQMVTFLKDFKPQFAG